ncbi:type II toxin-antitoxin system VapC family toxin [soil metagenome]
MRYVVDASVAVKWYVPEIFEVEASRVLEAGAELHAPELIVPEFANIIWKKVRSGELSEKNGQKVLSAFGKCSLVLHPHRRLAKSAFTGACLSAQTVYDWTYLSLAIALSCGFVTADRKFYRALESTPLRNNLVWIGDVQ